MAPSPGHRFPDAGSSGHLRPPDPRRALGRLGEDLAASHLERLGFAILDRNVRTREGEIDLIAFDGRVLAFVEVKTRRVRRSNAFADAAAAQADPRAAVASDPPALPAPLEGLRRRQRARLRRLATAWLQERSPAPHADELRFDAIGILIDRHDRLLRLDHVEGAW